MANKDDYFLDVIKMPQKTVLTSVVKIQINKEIRHCNQEITKLINKRDKLKEELLNA